MDVSSVGAAGTTRADKSASSLADNFDTFLTLLTTQLQNQDPMDPMDSNEFTKQLVEFSGVEQAIHTNQNLEDLIALISSSQSSNAVGYLGKDAVATASTTRLEEDGEATWDYKLPKEAASAAATITNSAGRVVYVGAATGKEGANTFTWDGNDKNGNPLPAGDYTINIAARDADGKTITPTVSIKGSVTSVDFSGSEPVLTVGGSRVPLSAITSITAPAGGSV